MNTIDLLFCTNPRNPMSWAIRVGSWSKWSHVALIDGDDVIEAVALKGVVHTPLATRKKEDPTWAVATLPCQDPSAIVAAARGQLGKPYDYTAVVGIGLHRDWQQTDRWFCSELVAWSFEEGGSPLFRPEACRRVTPQDLWMLSPVGMLAVQP
ncbi:MAG TPA: YiiX/YebB-like N1pC/P60 family cysteine hydrolase [Dyella sp.]|uniref:YiiX/YebB-like N1pC/P60 family cysteine hydrolase n=1 Tax=Dyella sp. TaxID=1869338 RepID=UPI002BEAE482|nr:YiiX/YebB-like N1pC/P60 family cysteine hydrolase [Dyella sp.]HUB91414.1 YiiX/YebB-like N1pC/P60 family cysteine hydrolase [Dyella sp.]